MPATFHSPSQIAFSDQILEAAPCGILVYHANGRCLKANPAAAGMVGASVAQLLQQNFRAIDSWRKAGLDLLAEKTLATGELQQGEFNCATTFGLELWANCKFTRLCHDAQYFLVLFFEDCSAQRRAEAELQARREMLRHVINNLPAFVFVTDREHRYTLVNTAYCRYLGREAERILGATHHDFYPRETADRFCQTNGEIMTKGITIKQNEAVGSRIMLSVKSPLHNSDGEVVGLCGVVSDITEERYQEEAKRQDQRLEAVAHLAGGLAHEFNNLLSGIQLNLELIRQDLPLPVDDDPVVESENLCLRAANLVRELLAYSHRSLIRPEILDLEELTATHLDAIRIMAGGKITVNLAS
ncbi:MAG TPA: PAS domain-containing protein, partial [Verrucomicrobiae bacterium]